LVPSGKAARTRKGMNPTIDKLLYLHGATANALPAPRKRKLKM